MTAINAIAEEGPIAEAEALNDRLAGLDLAGRLSFKVLRCPLRV